MTALMFSAFAPPPTGTSDEPMPVSSPRAAAAKAGETSLMWQCVKYGRRALQNSSGSLPAMKVLPVSKLKRRKGELKCLNSRVMNSRLLVYGPWVSTLMITL